MSILSHDKPQFLSYIYMIRSHRTFKLNISDTSKISDIGNISNISSISNVSIISII